MAKDIEYKYNEENLINEIAAYVDSTYGQHYAKQGKGIQTTEFIIDNGHGVGFIIGNMMKYTQRYGKKGDPEDWRKDIMKVIHYGIMCLYNHDLEHPFPAKRKLPANQTKDAPIMLLNENDKQKEYKEYYCRECGYRISDTQFKYARYDYKCAGCDLSHISEYGIVGETDKVKAQENVPEQLSFNYQYTQVGEKTVNNLNKFANDIQRGLSAGEILGTV